MGYFDAAGAWRQGPGDTYDQSAIPQGVLVTPSVKGAKAALKVALRAERQARKRAKRRARADARVASAEKLALKTLRAIANDTRKYSVDARIEAARELLALGRR